MEIKLGRDLPPQKAEYVKIIIGENQYRFTEDTKTGRLIINKYVDGDGDTQFAVYPRVGNEVEIL